MSNLGKIANAAERGIEDEAKKYYEALSSDEKKDLDKGIEELFRAFSPSNEHDKKLMRLGFIVGYRTEKKKLAEKRES